MRCIDYSSSERISGKDFDGFTSTGLYQLQNPVQYQNKSPGLTSGVVGFLLVGGWNAARIVQVLFTDAGSYIRYKNSSSWSAWATIDVH